MGKIIFVIGVSGSGKSTIGKALSSILSIPFFDADDFHPHSNVEKMSRGIALDDIDRKPWLEAINAHCIARQTTGCVFACSALKSSYRKVLAKNLINLQWVSLIGTYDMILERVNSRKDHFMPPKLLQSQFDTWEQPISSIEVDIADHPEQIVNKIINQINGMSSEFGLIGLGVMGKSLSRNLANNGFKLSLYNRHVPDQEVDVAERFISEHKELKEAQGFDDVKAFVNSLVQPRKIMLMVNAGKAVDAVISELSPLLDKGDVIIDGGNSHYKETDRRAKELASKGLEFIGTGVSGGEEGALKGPSIMPGGSTDAYKKVALYLETIAAKDSDGSGCCAHVGEGGAGHFVKMVHNGIEYAEMQLIAEVYSLLRYVGGKSTDEIADLFEQWCSGDLGSYLLEISYQILRKKEGEQAIIDIILDKAGNKGTGSWTTIAAAELGVPITMITAALFARYTSAFKQERISASKKYSNQIVRSNLDVEQIKSAYRVARIANHHQGLHLIDAASQAYSWKLNFSEIARIWTNGCIIRSELMKTLIPVLADGQRLLQDHRLIPVVIANSGALAQVVSKGHLAHCSIPCFSAASDFVNTYTQAQSSANMIQAQRDFFGAHTYKRVDDPNGPSHHTIW